MMDRTDAADRVEPAEANAPIDRTDAYDPIEPTDNAEPTDPIDRTEFFDHRHSTEFSDPMDHFELRFTVMDTIIATPRRSPTRCSSRPRSRSTRHDQHVQRLVREAMFLLIFGSRPAIRSALRDRFFGEDASDAPR